VRRPVWAEIDLGAVAHNVGVLRSLVAPAGLCAVVKAGAYGHGAVEVARAALRAGASWLAVALVKEGQVLRDAGLDAPVLLLSEPPAGLLADVVALRLTPTLYTSAGVEAAAKAVAESGADPLPVHVKVDSGMHRCGAAPGEAMALAVDVAERRELRMEGLWTHFAVADDPAHPFTEEQVCRFDAVVARLAELDIRPPLLHACNSAAALTRPACRHQLVRCGITLYGVPPSPALAGAADLRPVMSDRKSVV
jgi:alanine racemase